MNELLILAVNFCLHFIMVDLAKCEYQIPEASKMREGTLFIRRRLTSRDAENAVNI